MASSSSSSSSADIAGLRAKYGLELNRLVALDIPKGQRRGALVALNSAFVGARASVTEATAPEFFTVDVLPRLAQVLGEPVESHREKAAQLIVSVCEKYPVLIAPSAAALFPAISSRLGVLPLPEQSEDVRVVLIELMSTLIVPPAADAIRDHFSDVCDTLSRAATAGDPRLKADVGRCVNRLCTVVPDAIHARLGDLTSAMAANLSNQQAQARSESLKAIGALLPCGAESLEKVMRELVVDVVRGVGHDRKPAVRAELAKVVATLLIRLPKPVRESHEGLLVGALLSRVADDYPSVQATAFVELERAGAALKDVDTGAGAGGSSGAETPALVEDGEIASAASIGASSAGAGASASASSSATAKGADDDGDDVASPPLPEPFGSKRPSSGTRFLVGRLVDAIVPPALVDLADWQLPTRRAAAGQLRSLVICAEKACMSKLSDLFMGLCRASSDDEADIRALASETATLLGRYIDPAAQLGVLLPQVRLAGDHRRSTIAVLGAAVAGMKPQELLEPAEAPCLLELAAALAMPSLHDGELPGLRHAVVAAVSNVVNVAGSHCASVPGVLPAIAVALIRLMSADVDPEVVAEAQSVADRLASQLGMCALDMFQQQASHLLRKVGATIDPDEPAEGAPVDSWTKHSPNRLAFDALIRHYAPSVREEPLISEVIAVFTNTLNPKRDADLRISMLALLDSFVGPHEGAGAGAGLAAVVPTDSSAAAAFSAAGDSAAGGAGAGSGAGAPSPAQELDMMLRMHSTDLLEVVLMPNLVWKVGRVASTIRKVAIACMYTMLKRSLVDADDAVLKDLMTNLKTCLTDSDSSTRHITCLVLSRLFREHIRLNGEEVRGCYDSFVKCLDDSSDQVRIAACVMLKSFIGTAPPADMRGAPAEYTVDCLLVHIDDPDPAIQEAAFKALQVVGKVDPAYTIKEANNARLKHRSTHYLDSVIASLEADAP